MAVQLSSALSPREMLAGCTASVTEGAGAAVSGAEYEPLQAANDSRPSDAIAREATANAFAVDLRSDEYIEILQTPIWR